MNNIYTLFIYIMTPSEREIKIFSENADTKISKATPQQIKDFAKDWTARELAKSMGRKRPRNGSIAPYNSLVRSSSVRPSQIALPLPRRASVVRVRHSPINRNTLTRRSNFFVPRGINSNTKTNAQRSTKKKRKKKTKNIKKRQKKRKSNKRKSNKRNSRK